MMKLLQEILFTFVRYGAVALAGWFVSKGVWTQDQAAVFTSPDVVSWIVAGLLAVIIGIYKTYRNRIKFLAALRAAPGTTEDEIHAKLRVDRSPLIVPLLLGATLIPFYTAAYSAACAPSKRARVVQAYQSTQIGLGAVQDAELALYKSGTVPALTLEKHQEINRAFVKAFRAQITFGNALLAWRSEGVQPSGYAEWLAAIDETLAVLSDLLPSDRALFDTTIAWTRNVIAIIRSLGLVVPPRLATIGGMP